MGELGGKMPGKPARPLFEGVRVRLDQEISLDAAMLLGVPFTWGRCEIAYRYVRTSEGLKIAVRDIVTYDRRQYWSLEKYDLAGVMSFARKYHVFHPVEFDGEGSINLD